MEDVRMKGFGWKASSQTMAALCALMLTLTICFPAQAFAYFSKPAVGIYFGSSSVSLTTGSSSSVGLTIDPASEQQLPGCGMSICPQACNGLETPEGVMGGCLNEAGWCTCGGTGYYTEYTSVSVSSSNPYVARASASGGALLIQAVSPGTATITVYASLAKHVDNSASMTVTVSDPAPSSPSAPSDGGSSGGSTGGSGSGAGSGGGGGVSVTATGTSATAAAAAASANGEDQKVVEMETEDGKKIIVAQATDATSAAEELKKIAGTEGTCTFWSGGTLDSPSISWTFKGTDLSPDADLNFDSTVEVSKKGTGDVAKLLADVKNAIVMDFVHSGKLPATAEVYVRASGAYDDGTKLGLYSYDEEMQKFVLEQENVEVTDGYAVFPLDHCSTWALSDEDLSALAMPVDQATDDVPEGQVAADEVNVHAQDGTPFIIAAAVIAVVAVVAATVFVVMRRRRAATAADEAKVGDEETTDVVASDRKAVMDKGADGAHA